MKRISFPITIVRISQGGNARHSISFTPDGSNIRVLHTMPGHTSEEKTMTPAEARKEIRIRTAHYNFNFEA